MYVLQPPNPKGEQGAGTLSVNMIFSLSQYVKIYAALWPRLIVDS